MEKVKPIQQYFENLWSNKHHLINTLLSPRVKFYKNATKTLHIQIHNILKLWRRIESAEH